MASDPIPAPDKPLDLLDVALFVRAALLANVTAAGREFGVSAAVASARSSNASSARCCTAPRAASASRRTVKSSWRTPTLLSAADAARASVGHGAPSRTGG